MSRQTRSPARIGDRFGRLTITAMPPQEGRTYVTVGCECGEERSVLLANLRSGNTRSCGCLQRARTAAANTTHGATGTPLWKVWANMRQRCADPNTKDFLRYGGRGIKVCDEWSDFPPFQDWALANGYVPGLTIERTDNDGDYCPENCRWVDRKAQARNRRTTVMVEAFGETRPTPEWAEDPRCVVSYTTLRQRLMRGWPAERAITTPPLRQPE